MLIRGGGGGWLFNMLAKGVSEEEEGLFEELRDMEFRAFLFSR